MKDFIWDCIHVLVCIVRGMVVWLDDHSSFMIMLATTALAAITYLYLRETKKQRLLTERAVLIDTSPKVFIKNIESTIRPDIETKTIEIRTTFVVQNCGGTEARNVSLPFVMTYQGQRHEGMKGPFQYLFPGQVSAYTTRLFGVPLNDEQMERLKPAIESKKPLTFSFSTGLPAVQLEVKVVYEDLQGNKQETPYSLKYHWDRNKWSYTAMKIE